MRRILELDGLRAVAICLVLGCHYAPFAASLHGLPEFGWVGVDLFFALSGYLITTILLGMRNRPHPYRTFYARRFARIFPPYFSTLILVLLLAAVMRRPELFHPGVLVRQVFFLQAFVVSTAKFFLRSLLHPLQFLASLPPLLSGAHRLPRGYVGLYPTLDGALDVYWSLSIEEYFYLFWAPVVLRCSRSGIVVVGILICTVEILMRWGLHSLSAYFDLLTRFDALIYGAFAALLLSTVQKHVSKRILCHVLRGAAVCCVLAIAACLWLLHPVLGREVRASPLFLVCALPAIGIASAALVGLLVLRTGSSWWFARLVRASVFQYIGTISYTMYLVHILAAFLVMTAWQRVFPSSRFTWPEAVLSVFVTVAMARASWHFLEKPVLAWKDRRYPSAPHPPEPLLN